MSERSAAAQRNLTFGLTWLAYASYYLGRKGFSITKVRIAAELGLATPALALIDTAFLLAYALGQVPSGLLADRLGPRRLIAFGMLGSAAACGLFGSATGASVFVVAYAVNGLMQATGWPGTTKAMAEHTSALDRGRVMGLWSTCYTVGGIAASALATYLLAHHGWRAAFQLPALWLFATGVIVLVLLPDGRAGRAPEPSAAGEAASGTRSLLRDPVIYAYAASYFCLKLIRYSLLFWLPYYLHTAVGFDEEHSGYLSTAFEIGGVVGSVGLGHASDRLARSRAFAALLSLLGLACALALYAVLHVAAPAYHFAAIALIGALLFGPDSLLSGAAAQEAGGPRASATAVSLVNACGSAGALLQGALTLGVERAFGWNGLFYAFLALSLLAAACLAPAARTRSHAHAV